MKLHLNNQDFKDFTLLTAQYFSLPSHFIEKDYWITYVLSNLSKSKHSNSFIFKGGTALSKAYKIISRFSEDIDLTFSIEGLTSNQRKKIIDATSKEITTGLPEVNKLGITSKGSRFRRTSHEYPILFSKIQPDQSSETLIIEINSFIQPKDFYKFKIESYISEFLKISNKEDIIAQFNLEPFELNILGLKRTFTEKILSLVRASYLENPTYELQKRIRHFYDIHMLLKQKEIQDFLHSEEFYYYLAQTKNDDASNQEFSGDWVSNKLYKAPVFQNYNVLWKSLEKTYNGIFSILVYSKVPESSLIYESFKQIISKINSYPDL